MNTVYDDIYLAKGLSKLESSPQTINIRSASFAKVRGRFPWNTLKSFNLSICPSPHEYVLLQSGVWTLLLHVKVVFLKKKVFCCGI